jgi:multicomponent Na+:H+ antiporter subunit G
MTLEQILDLAGAVVIALGAFFCLAAAVGLVRFPDVITRMHAATKPVVFGLILVLVGVTLSLRDPKAFALLGLAVLLQMLTAPVSGHLVSRTAYRDGEWDADSAVVDDLHADTRFDEEHQ